MQSKVWLALALSLITFPAHAEFTPDDWYHMGTTYYFMKNQPHEATCCYLKALPFDPFDQTAFFSEQAYQENNSKILYALGMSLLDQGDFEHGWPIFEARFFYSGCAHHTKAYLTAHLEELKGKTVLISNEWGLGDKLQFIRYAQVLKDHGIKVIAHIEKRLIPLFSLCPYIDELFDLSGPQPPADIELSMLSLPLLCKTTLSNVPHHIPYLYANQELKAYWKTKVDLQKQLRIGICWQTHPGYVENYDPTRRSFPLSLIADSLMTYSSIAWYSLQKGDGIQQIAQLPVWQQEQLHDFSSELDEAHGAFMDSAALIEHLDLIITTDTSVAHLAGALGKLVWVLLPYTADWRWMYTGDSSPWYPTMRLFRQESPGDWHTVLHAVKIELENMLKSDQRTSSSKGSEHA